MEDIPQITTHRPTQPERGYVSRWMMPKVVVEPSRVRVWPFVVTVVIVFVVLFGRLSQLTLVEGAYRRDLADDNRIIALRRTAARGIFYDRHDQPLVKNIPIYKRQKPSTTVAQGLYEEITHEEAVELSIAQGEQIFFDSKRMYTCGEACAQLLGYLGEVDATELEQHVGAYVLGDSIGKSGLEKMYEDTLRGTPGNELVEVNARGDLVREVGRDAAQAGVDLRLTIDQGLQELLYAALAGRKGAAVAQVPDTGEVLALVSSPSYDPQHIAQALTSEDMPFMNRAIGGAYAPGSVFKIVTSVAGLEEEVIDVDDTYVDTGEITIDEYRYGNWYYDDYGRTEGEVNVIGALRRSNDIFYYKLGGDLGADRLATWATNFGFGNPAGLVAIGEIGGTIPTPLWKERTKGERWYLGNTYHMSIGQGDVLVTPLQVNRMMSAVAARGNLCPPTFLAHEVGSRSCAQLNLQAKTLETIQTGLIQACQPGGTGVPFFDFVPQVACKTGTAQAGGEADLPHAWFTVYAPADDPQIALTVLVEHGGQGSAVAAPIAREAMEYYFQGDVDLSETFLQSIGVGTSGDE